jgi:hypothetical protein
MNAIAPAVSAKTIPFSPLILADRLLSLAQDADRAGYTGTASQLVAEMYQVLDGGMPVRH